MPHISKFVILTWFWRFHLICTLRWWFMMLWWLFALRINCLELFRFTYENPFSPKMLLFIKCLYIFSRALYLTTARFHLRLYTTKLSPSTIFPGFVFIFVDLDLLKLYVLWSLSDSCTSQSKIRHNFLISVTSTTGQSRKLIRLLHFHFVHSLHLFSVGGTFLYKLLLYLFTWVLKTKIKLKLFNQEVFELVTKWSFAVLVA